MPARDPIPSIPSSLQPGLQPGTGEDWAWSLQITDQEFRDISELILSETGISLGGHKRSLIISRLGKRLRHLGLRTFTQYYHYLTTEDHEQTELRETINCVTTNKTDFFREAYHFDFLREHLLQPKREQARRGGARRLRIWSAACSTGEEPYSIAMTIAEEFASLEDWDIKILASDIDTNVLRQGEAGIYDERNLSLPADHLKHRYFLRGTGSQAGRVQIKPGLRRLVSFRRINFVEPQWPIKTRFDAIFCRNVIIYFNRETQRRLFERLTQYLKPDAYLFVGHSENLYQMSDLVAPIGHTVYRLRPRRTA